MESANIILYYKALNNKPKELSINKSKRKNKSKQKNKQNKLIKS